MKANKVLKKTFVALLAGIMICGASGCKKTEKGDVADASKDDAKASKTEQPSKPSEPVDITYPLQTDETLRVWTRFQLQPNKAYKDYTESPFHMGLQKNTGVKATWEGPRSQADADTAYNIMLTEETLPDIIYTTVSTAEADQLIDDQVIYDLTEYLPIYAPDYWEYINRPENEKILKALKTDKGRLYNVGGMKESQFNVTYSGPVVRKDWLDECNLEEPVTLADWENVLKIFKEKYNATFGFYNLRMNSAGFASGTGAFGTFAGRAFVNKDNKVQLTQTQPEWKEYMEVLHRWYAEGLIDKDSITMDDAMISTKVLNNEIGVSYTATSQLSRWATDAKKAGSSANWIGVDYPRVKPGEPTCAIQTIPTLYINWGAMVTTECSEEKLITALKWLNYGFTEKGIQYWNFGNEGESHTKDADGNIVWSDAIKNDPVGLSAAIPKYSGTCGSSISIQLEQLVKERFTKQAIEAVYKWVDNTDSDKYVLPTLSLTEEERMTYIDTMTMINTFIEETSMKFLTGDESLDNYDKFVKELYDMGLQECMDIQQAAYERYLAK